MTRDPFVPSHLILAHGKFQKSISTVKTTTMQCNTTMSSTSLNVSPNDTFPNAAINPTDAYIDAVVKNMSEAFGLIPKL